MIDKRRRPPSLPSYAFQESAMFQKTLTGLLLLLLAACVAQEPAEPYAFVGSWDCGVEVFSFTNTSYNDGTNTYPIRSVAQDGRNYTLFIEGGFKVGLAAVTATGLTWISGTTGDQLNCRRLT
jgi:hypothetical protein